MDATDRGQNMYATTVDITTMHCPELGGHRDNNPSPQSNCSLPLHFCGAIFLCSNATFEECIKKKLFGARRDSFEFLQDIEIGFPLFLFNYEQKRMFGMFEAASKGELNIDPCAWSQIAGSQTEYPAQVRVQLVSNAILSLPESEVKEAIPSNYYDLEGSTYPSQFRFDLCLDGRQVSKLQNLFSVRSAGAPSRTTRILKGDVPHITAGIWGDRSRILEEKSDRDPGKLSRRQGLNSTRTLNLSNAVRTSIDVSFLQETWRTGAMGGPGVDDESNVRKRLSLPGPLEGLQDPVLRRTLVQQHSRKDPQSTGDHQESMIYANYIGRSREGVARERCVVEQEVLQDQRANQWSSLSSVGSTHTQTGMHHLEVFAMLIEEMHEFRIQLRGCIVEAKSRAKQVEHIHSALSTLDSSRVALTADLELLKREVEVLREHIGEKIQNRTEYSHHNLR